MEHCLAKISIREIFNLEEGMERVKPTIYKQLVAIQVDFTITINMDMAF